MITTIATANGWCFMDVVDDEATRVLKQAALDASNAALKVHDGLSEHGVNAPWDDDVSGTEFTLAMRDLHRNTAVLAHFFADQSRRRRRRP